METNFYNGCTSLHSYQLFCVLAIVGFFFLFLKKDFIYLFLERGEAKEKSEGEKHQCVIAFHAWVPTRDLAHNPGMCPDWELNWQPFGWQACTQSTEPHHQGIFLF